MLGSAGRRERQYKSGLDRKAVRSRASGAARRRLCGGGCGLIAVVHLRNRYSPRAMADSGHSDVGYSGTAARARDARRWAVGAALAAGGCWNVVGLRHLARRALGRAE